MRKEHHILGVDIGGTGIKGGLIDVINGELISERYKVATPQPATPAAVADKLKELLDHFAYQGPIGIGFPAIVRRGTALSATNIDKSWINTNIESTFSEVSGLPVYALNDADAAGIASINFGAGRDFLDKTVLMITVGTGIGSGLFVDGKLVPNTEMGHLYLKNHKTIAEGFVSNALRKRNEWSWNDFGKRLNKYLQHVDLLFSPDLILIGGGVSKSFAKFEGKLDVNADVRPTLLLNNAGAVGAAFYAYQKHHQKPA